MTDPKDPNKPDPPPGGDPPKTPQDPPKDPSKPEPVPYERFKEVNDKAKLLEGQIADLQKQIKAKEDAGKSEIEKLTEQVGTLTKSWEDAQSRALRLEVAQKAGIPVDLVDRLQGSTTEELTQDAERLKAFLKSPEGPGVPPPSRGGNAATFTLEGKTPEEIRKAFHEDKIKF